LNQTPARNFLVHWSALKESSQNTHMPTMQSWVGKVKIKSSTIKGLWPMAPSPPA